VDSRFIEKDGKRAENKKPAKVKTSLDDVKLAKPEVLSDKGEQPVPLEYKDLLR
jgi:hypothetical protein